jgi:hypothetical protein
MARDTRWYGFIAAVGTALVLVTGCGGGDSGAKAEILNLAGKIVAPEAAQALVTVTVGNRAFQTQADASGNYSIEVQADPALRSALVTLSAKLTGNRSFVELLSRVGTFSEAQTAAGSDGTLVADDSIRVNLSNLTTVEAALIEEAERGGGKAFTFGAGVDPDAALKLAGALELATTDPANFALPQGTATTLALARDPQTRTSFIAEIQVNAPEALEQAQLSLVSNPEVVGQASAVPPELLAATLEIEGDFPFNRSNVVSGFEFAADGVGRYFDGGSSVTTSWVLDGTRIRVQYAQPIETVSFDPVDCNGTGEISQQQRRFSETGVDVVRISATAVSLSSVNTITTPACPNVPPETRMFTVGKTVLGESSLQNFGAADVAGRSLSIAVLGDAGFSRLPDDILDFQANGTGAGRFHVGALSWSVNAGTLVVNYGTGIEGRYRPVRTIDGLARALFVDYRGPDGRFADIALSLLRDPALAFAAAEVPGRYFQFGIGEENGGDPRLQGFRLRFDADGRGSEESDFIDPSGAVAVSQGGFSAFRWTLEGNGELAVRRFRGSEDFAADCDPQAAPCVLWDERIIAPVNRVGERFYWLERRRSDFGGGVDATDPQTFLSRFYDRVPGSASGTAKSAASSLPQTSVRAGLRERE